MKAEFYRLREAREGDRAFIISTWVNSYRRALPVANLNPQVYHEGQRRLIESIFRRIWPGGVGVAHSIGEIEHIMGWSATEQDCIHYVYVKPMFRFDPQGGGMRLASALLGIPAPSVSHSHYVDGPAQRALREKLHSTYNPYLAWR